MAYFSVLVTTNSEAGLNGVKNAATFLKIAALSSAIVTSVFAALILGRQVLAWIFTNEWPPFPVSAALALAGLGEPTIYVTASVSENPADSSQTILAWFFDLPASGLLLAVVAMLVGFSVFAASIEKQYAAIEK
jgi:hypothetical protein